MNFINFDQVKEILLKAKTIKVNNKSILINEGVKQDLLTPFFSVALYYGDLDNYFVLTKTDKFFLYRNLIVVTHKEGSWSYSLLFIKYE